MVKTGAEGSVNAAGVSYGELIRRQRHRAGMSQEELGALAGVGKNAVGAWEAGRSRPDLNSVPRICEALSIPVTEFLGVEDDCGVPEDGRAFLRKYTALDSLHRRIILREMDAMLDIQRKKEENRRPVVRLFRSELSACAGPSMEIGDAAGEAVLLFRDPVTSCADEIIRVSGNSMEPTFRDGDEVLVEHTTALREGEIGIFTHGDEGYIKEYRKDGLYSHNPAYPPLRFAGEDPVRCFGRVIGRLKAEQYAPAGSACESEE